MRGSGSLCAALTPLPRRAPSQTALTLCCQVCSLLFLLTLNGLLNEVAFGCASTQTCSPHCCSPVWLRQSQCSSETCRDACCCLARWLSAVKSASGRMELETRWMHKPDALLVHKPEKSHPCTALIIWDSHTWRVLGLALRGELSYVLERH